MTLERWMKIHGYTDGQFADLIGMSRVAVNLYRNGLRMPRPAVMQMTFIKDDADDLA